MSKHKSCVGCLFEKAWRKDGCSDCVLFSNWAPMEGEEGLSYKVKVDSVPLSDILSEAANDGSSADYYVLPANAAQLQDLIAFRNMNAQLGEIFRAAYRYGQPGHHSSRERDLRKIIFYAQAELDRLEKYEGGK